MFSVLNTSNSSSQLTSVLLNLVKMARWQTDREIDRKKAYLNLWTGGAVQLIYSNSNREMIKFEGNPIKLPILKYEREKLKKSFIFYSI